MKNLINILEGNPIREKEEKILGRIKDLREQKNFSQHEIGQKLGISQNAYYKIEKGYTKLDLQRLIQLSYIFEIELRKLVC